MKTAFDYIRNTPPPEIPKVQFTTVDELIAKIDEIQAEFNTIILQDAPPEIIWHLQFMRFFQVSCTSKNACFVQFRGHRMWVAYENDVPVFATLQGVNTQNMPSSIEIVPGANKPYSDWRKITF
jgi:hypothetical protein